MDIWSKEKRSQVMARILSKDTIPEQSVRKILTGLGFKYRLHVSKLPGKPDIVLRKHNAVIFVHGCFWHLHSKCRDGTIPKSKTAYWRKKLTNNRKRDAKHIRELRQMGWKVLLLWECEVEKNPERVIKKIEKLLGI